MGGRRAALAASAGAVILIAAGCSSGSHHSASETTVPPTVKVSTATTRTTAAVETTTTNPPPTTTTVRATTTVRVTTTVPATTTTVPATTTTVAGPGPVAVAEDFVSGLYTWTTSEFVGNASSTAVQDRCAPYVTPGLDAKLLDVVAGPETDADTISWTPQHVTAEEVTDARPTSTFAPVQFEVTIAASPTGGSATTFQAGGELSLVKTSSGWKVVSILAYDVSGPGSTGPASDSNINISDPAYP
jgi:hypothetical protein